MATFLQETGEKQGWKVAGCNFKIFIKFPFVIFEVTGEDEQEKELKLFNPDKLMS